MITLGFVGVEAFDFILFLAKTLSNLGQKVLIVDVNHSKALSIVIGKAMGIDSKIDMTLSQGIYYIQRTPTEEELGEFHKGVIIVSMGWSDSKTYAWEFNTLFIVLNPYLHILQQFLDMKTKEEMNNDKMDGTGIEKCRFVLRDLTGAENKKQLCQMLHSVDDRIHFITFDTKDREIALNCQIKQQIKLGELSYDMKEWIQEVIMENLKHIKIREIKEAMKMSRKRYLHE